jgi:hypothetical protein
MEVDVKILENQVYDLYSAQREVALYVAKGYELASSSANELHIFHTLVKKTTPKVEED